MKISRTFKILICFVGLITNKDEACNSKWWKTIPNLKNDQAKLLTAVVSAAGGNPKPLNGQKTSTRSELQGLIKKIRNEAGVAKHLMLNDKLIELAASSAVISCFATAVTVTSLYDDDDFGFAVVKQVVFDLDPFSQNDESAIYKWIVDGKEQYEEQKDNNWKCKDESNSYCVGYEVTISETLSHYGCALVNCNDEDLKRNFVCVYGTTIREPDPEPDPNYSPDVRTVDQHEAVESHNGARSKVPAAAIQAVTWNTKLVEFVTKIAMKSCGGRLPRGRKFPDISGLGTVLLNVETVALEVRTKPVTKLVEGWSKQADLYEKNTGKCNFGLRRSACVSYRRMIRETITEIGCVRVLCEDKRANPENSYVVICGYAPFEEIEDEMEEKLNGRAYIPALTEEDWDKKCGKYGKRFDDDIKLCV